MKPIVCFGEILLRLTAPDHRRLRHCLPGTLETSFAGAEANVAVTLAGLGQPAEFVTALPRNEITDACVASLRGAGVALEHLSYVERGRLGLFFVEPGANQLAGRVVYDRQDSSFSQASATTYPWAGIFRQAGWFHTSGVSAAVSRRAAEATIASVAAARSAGLPVSFDVNFRRQLWRWEPGRDSAQLARQTLASIVPHVTVLLGNADDLSLVAPGAASQAPTATAEEGLARATALARAIGAHHPHLEHIAVTLRRGHSADQQEWGALLFSPKTDETHIAPLADGRYVPYAIRDVVDRIGTGDVFAGALIAALAGGEFRPPARALSFAVAASCLAHSIPGDFKHLRRAEIEHLLAGNDAGHLAR